MGMAQKVAAAMDKWRIPPLTEERKEQVQRYVNVMLTYQPCKVEDTQTWRRLPAKLPFWGVAKHRSNEGEHCEVDTCPLAHNKFEKRFHPLLYKACKHIAGELCAVTQGNGRDVVYCGFYHDSEDSDLLELARYIALLHLSQTSCPLGRLWRAKMPQAYADLAKEHADFSPARVNAYVYVMCCYKTVPCDAYLQGDCRCKDEWDCFDYHTTASRRRSPLLLSELAREDLADRSGHSRPENEPTVHITIERCSHLFYKRLPHGGRQQCKIVERHHNPIFCPFLHDTDDRAALEDARGRVARMEAAFLKQNPDVAQALEKARQNPDSYTPLVKIPLTVDVKELFHVLENPELAVASAVAPAPGGAASGATAAAAAAAAASTVGKTVSPPPSLSRSTSPQPKQTEEAKPATPSSTTTTTSAIASKSASTPASTPAAATPTTTEPNEEIQQEMFGVSEEATPKKDFPEEYFDGEYNGRAVVVRRRVRTYGCTFTAEERFVQQLPGVCENVCQALVLEQDAGYLYHVLPGDVAMPMSAWIAAVREGCRPGAFHAFGETERTFFRGIARGLSFLHALGVRYTALSPATVLVDRLGRPRLCAFDEARFVRGSATGPTPFVQTAFMAPEVLASQSGQAGEEVGPRADSFSFGLLVWLVLTGRHAYGAKEAQQRRNICDAAFQPRPLDIVQGQPELFWLLQHLLIRRADGRYTAAQILQHPALWGAAQRVQLFCETALYFAGRPECARAFDEAAHYARVAPDWTAALDPVLRAHLPAALGARPPDPASLADVLRLVCNLALHYDALPPALHALFQSCPDGLAAYFARRFPTLLVAVFKYVSENLADLAPFIPFLANNSPQDIPFI